LPPAVIAAAASEWFPAGSSGSGLTVDLASFSTAHEAKAEESASPVEFSESRLPGVEWIRTGRWRVEKYSLQYRPSGHEDDFVRAWLDLSLLLMNSPDNFDPTGERFSIGDAAEQLFDVLADPDTKPGEARGPGRCTKCHSRTGSDIAEPRLIWAAFQPETRRRGLTRFRHSPHLQLGSQEACLECHRPNADNESERAKSRYLEAYLDDVNNSVPDGNFVAIEKQTCGNCHAPEAAGDGCLICHNYHVDPSTSGPSSLATARRGPASGPPL
jgi:hypothetical protein